jgi:hypothetical protein
MRLAIWAQSQMVIRSNSIGVTFYYIYFLQFKYTEDCSLYNEVIIIIIIIIVFMRKVVIYIRLLIYLSPDSIHANFVGQDIKVPHCRHVCNCCLTSNLMHNL